MLNFRVVIVGVVNDFVISGVIKYLLNFSYMYDFVDVESIMILEDLICVF